MYDKLRRAIKSDSDSQQLYGEFLDEYHANQGREKKKKVKSNIVSALFVAVASLISLFFLVYAQIENGELQKEVYTLEKKLDNCENG